MSVWPFKKKRSTETGEQNAQRFVSTVREVAADNRFIEFYPHPAWSGGAHRRYNWPWMINEAWRARVLELLRERDIPVRDAQFLPPDSLDGWTFSAYSTVPVPRVAQLRLDQVL